MSYTNGVVHDMDGTFLMLGENSSYVDVFADLFRQTLKDITGRDFSSWRKRELYPAIALPYEKSVRFMQEKLGINYPKTFWRKLEERDYESRKSRIGTEITLFPDAWEYLEMLERKNSGIIRAVLTNTPNSITEMQLEGLGLSDFFHELYPFGYNEPNSKPSPWAILQMVEKHSLSTDSVWIFGDGDTDIHTGEAAGVWKGQLFREGHIHYDNETNTEPDIEGRTLPELWEKSRQFMEDYYEMQVREKGCVLQEV